MLFEGAGALRAAIQKRNEQTGESPVPPVLFRSRLFAVALPGSIIGVSERICGLLASLFFVGLGLPRCCRFSAF